MAVNRASVKYNIGCVLTRSKHPSVALALSHLISATNEAQRSLVICPGTHQVSKWQ